jgi:hypothetical protein
MNDANAILSNRDALLFAVPFLVILFLSMFRLDQLIAAPKRPVRQRPSASDIDEHGEQILRDPDGRPADPRQTHTRPYTAVGHTGTRRTRRVHWIAEGFSAQDEV